MVCICKAGLKTRFDATLNYTYIANRSLCLYIRTRESNIPERFGLRLEI